MLCKVICSCSLSTLVGKLCSISCYSWRHSDLPHWWDRADNACRSMTELWNKRNIAALRRTRIEFSCLLRWRIINFIVMLPEISPTISTIIYKTTKLIFIKYFIENFFLVAETTQWHLKLETNSSSLPRLSVSSSRLHEEYYFYFTSLFVVDDVSRLLPVTYDNGNEISRKVEVDKDIFSSIFHPRETFTPEQIYYTRFNSTRGSNGCYWLRVEIWFNYFDSDVNFNLTTTCRKKVNRTREEDALDSSPRKKNRSRGRTRK